MSKVLLQIENLKPTIRHNLLFMGFESDSVTLLLMDEKSCNPLLSAWKFKYNVLFNHACMGKEGQEV
jgi:hypothetical protein